MRGGLKYTGKILETLQGKCMIFLIENKIRGGISSVTGQRSVKSDRNKTIWYIDAKTVYVWTISQSLPKDEIKIVKKSC